MAKKVVASIQKGGGKKHTKVIKMSKSDKTGNYTFKQEIVHNDNVTREFADLVKSMMAKKPDGRPASMWEFLKVFRGTQVFRKRPRKPEVTVFDSMPGLKGADDMLRKGKPDPGLDVE